MNIYRVVEHHVVIGATTEILGHSNWYYEHDSGGRPVLFENGDQSDKRVSISHIQCPEGSSYAAVILAQVDHNIGVDIVYTDDDRLDRIATRTMSEDEIKNGRLPEIWAIKEAVFKAYGPGVDFKNDIVVKTPIENSKANVRFKDEEKELDGARCKLFNASTRPFLVRASTKQTLYKPTRKPDEVPLFVIIKM